ncbi:MAG: PilZ domain-containing protein [Terriglobales bacterium]|jgi:hypothetical protein
MASAYSEGVPDVPDRICSRYVFEAKIWIRLERAGKKFKLPGWVRNLSESGLGGFVAEPLRLGETVALEIPLADNDKHTIPAKVVRALGTEFGFQFTALSGEQRQRIQAALQDRPVIPYHDN